MAGDFLKEELINICPIYKNAFEAIRTHNHVFSLWDAVAHKTGEERDVMDLRMSHNIGHGLGLAIKSGEIRESFVIAGEADDKYFGYNIAKNHKVIEDCLSSFRKNIKL
ncbi:hypothetical protein [Vibrio sp.]|uniref:hypothetical protein n=1 Tax=Vibrio sp. TaxID=678 RepID=UPI003120521F